MTVKSYDYAAFGTLKVEALIGGVWYRQWFSTRGFWITIPRDHDSDLIADSWEQAAVHSWNLQYGPQPPLPEDESFFANNDDKEQRDPDGPGPLGAHAAIGDSYTVFEEYWGFVGTDSTDSHKHARLDPARKELLIVSTSWGSSPNRPVRDPHGLTTSKSSFGISYEDAQWTPGVS